MSRISPRRSARFALAIVAAWVALAGPGLPAARPVAAATGDGVEMEARVLLEGHARLGSWVAIEVRLRNGGPSVVGELRLQGGTQGGTRYSLPVDLPTTSDKTFIIHAQPPSFGQQLEVLLVADDEAIIRQKVAFTLHDAGQLTIGVVAAVPQGILGGLNVPADRNVGAPVVIPLEISDLPDRIEAWSALDRLIWQDVETDDLSAEQLAALRGWLALGGRLVVVGGSTGPGILSGLPDELLPYRPSTTIDVAPSSLAGIVSTIPDGAVDIPALAGELIRGRVIAASGEQVIAAETPYGSGSVAVVGFDPTVGWIAESRAAAGLWVSMIPPRSAGAAGMTDDTNIVQAVSELPVLALPPIGGLLLLLFGYIALIGPINYFVLRRLDRREWAWVTMPVLIAVFAAGSYGFGAALRGSDVIVNEVAIVRGAPDTTEGSAQVYLGVFSPTRGTYQVAALEGALLSSPINGDVFGGQGLTLDVVQGRPSRIRNLSVGFGSLRTIRAETAAAVPRIHAELALVDGTLTGFLRNDSDVVLESPAVVLGGSVAVLQDLAPGAQADVRVAVTGGRFTSSLGDAIIGQQYYGDTPAASENERRARTRYRVINQLTYESSMSGMGMLNSEVPVVLAWGRAGVMDVEVEGQKPSRAANVLYYIPVGMEVRGETTFRSDLVRNTIVEADAAVFSKDPFNLSFGQGTVTVAYRPISFQGTFDVSRIVLAMGFGGEPVAGDGAAPVEPLPAACAAGNDEETREAAGCPAPPDEFDGMPDVEVFDRTGEGRWLRLPRFGQAATVSLASPERYVEPTTGTLLVRFVNETQNSVGHSFHVGFEGVVR